MIVKLKEILKKISFIVEIKTKLSGRKELNRRFTYEKNRYAKSSFKIGLSSDFQHLKALLFLFSHALEKGLSRTNFRPGFGEAVLLELKRTMNKFNDSKHDKNTGEYVMALATLKAYYDKHKEITVPKHFTDYFESYMGEILDAEAKQGGVNILTKDKKEKNKDADYKTLFENRVSIREFSDEPVDIELINEAISLSMKTPTVCNRQSQRVKIITNPELIEKVLRYQGGFSGYKSPPVLALVTTDLRDFGNNEYKSTYIDGGLFGMSLLLSLEYVGLAACALNATQVVQVEEKIREILELPLYENTIMFIVIGKFKDEVSYPVSWRKETEEITTFFN